MRKIASPVPLDFVAPAGQSRVLGAILCLAGIAAATQLGLSFQRQLAERNRLDGLLAAVTPQRKREPASDAAKLAAEAAAVERELNIPWTRLLAELELASHDDASIVSLLHVEPDPAKQLLRVTAEVRALPDALTYLKRLQRSAVLRYPVLESHERRKDDPQHPLLIKVAAEWKP